jgi:adenosylcobinamide-phosphate synthase
MWFGYEELAVLAFAVALDLILGEPPTWAHPTVWMGRMTAVLEKAAPRQGVIGVLAGAIITLLVAGLSGAAAYFAAEGLKSVHIVAYILVGGVALKTTFSIRMLHREAAKARQNLDRGDIQGVRAQMPALVSRDPSQLTAQQATAATVESVSENISDSLLGPWLAFALFGLPGAFAYRAINTLDSMIGYRGTYEYLGKAAARLDDLLNLVPARLSGLLVVGASALLPGQRAKGAWRIMWRHHGRTQSPNAGWTMSGMAGALGVQLEKVAAEGGYILGEPTRALESQDITRAVQTMYAVAALGLVLALAIVYARTGIF